MKKILPVEISNSFNQEVLNAIEGASCHSDIIIPISRCLGKLEGVQSFCPDGKNFSYICWYVNDVVFAYATGMQKVSVKLNSTKEIEGFNPSNNININNIKGWYSVPYNYRNLCATLGLAYKAATKFNSA